MTQKKEADGLFKSLFSSKNRVETDRRID